jgi:hypothetical protein|tara:strand:+ start:1524 stop:1859 length:336 start_codon:yes stop_codon:yes gene_type:complete
MIQIRNLSEKLKQFIKHVNWVFAKTYATTWPHEYIVRDQVNESLFIELVEFIRANGYVGKFYKMDITYFDEDGMVYWTMGDPVETTTIINRCTKEQSYEYRLAHNDLPNST